MPFILFDALNLALNCQLGSFKHRLKKLFNEVLEKNKYFLKNYQKAIKQSENPDFLMNQFDEFSVAIFNYLTFLLSIDNKKELDKEIKRIEKKLNIE